MNSNENSQITKRIALLKAAAKRGDVQSSYELGKMYEYDLKDYPSAIRFYEQAASAGCYKSKTNLGLMLKNGLGVPKPNYRRAYELFTSAAAQGDAVAWYNIGQLYHNGAGEEFSVQPEKAVLNYEISANLGDPYAMYLLGRIYDCGFHHIKINHAKALEYYENAVYTFNKQGSVEIPLVYYFLGSLYFTGKGTIRNFEKAFENFTIASKLGVPKAYITCGLACMNAWGCQKDLKKGFEYFKKAADLAKDADAMLFLSDCYLFGDGTEKDEEKSFEYLIKAAEFGNIKAKKLLATEFTD